MHFLTAFLFAAAVANSSSSEPLDYETAYQRALNGDKPLLVLVTADWCPPCQTMKSTTIPQMIEENRFSGVHFATVDCDKDFKDARNLLGGRKIPQLILFERKDDKWTAKYLQGVQSVASVDAFIGSSDPIRTASNEQVNK